MLRRPLSVVIFLTIFVLALPALAQESAQEPAQEAAPGSETPEPAEPEIYPIVFPVAGEVRYTDTWGAPRSGGRSHHGVDMLAEKMVPVLAAADGTVDWMHDEQGGNCCAMALLHDDGWESWYIHLNNDTPGTDDGLGWGFAEGISSGVRVEAGQVIGYVGDSGNAEWSSPHLHFELHQPDGTPINPYPHVYAAETGQSPPPTDPPEPPPEPDPVPNELPVEDEHPRTVMADARGGKWHVREETGQFTTYTFGGSRHQPLWGDWDCDGEKTHGMYRKNDGYVYLNNRLGHDAVEIGFFLGGAGDVALAGDFNGDGCDTVAAYRQNEGRVFIANELGSGNQVLEPDYSYYFGDPGDKPYVGDFNGDGIDTLGLHRESSGFVYFRQSHTQGFADHEFYYGIPNDRLTAGDFNDNGVDTLLVFRPTEQKLYIRNSNTLGVADVEFQFGYQHWIPVS